MQNYVTLVICRLFTETEGCKARLTTDKQRWFAQGTLPQVCASAVDG